jgi:SAM-dependent methyltransferase
MASTEQTIDSNWFEQSFGELYPVVYAHRTIESAAPESEFAVQQLGIKPHERVLDLCCGNGRHLVHLHAHTHNIIGLDYSDELLTIAHRTIDAQFVRADMRAIPFADSLDAVVNFFTSFGYFEDENENRAVVHGVAGALKSGGRFLIDYVNADQARDTLVAQSERIHGEYAISESRWIDEAGKRLNKTTVITHNGARCAELGESVRLYSLDDLRALLTDSGLEVGHVFGDYDGSTFGVESPRMIFVGRKPSTRKSAASG